MKKLLLILSIMVAVVFSANHASAGGLDYWIKSITHKLWSSSSSDKDNKRTAVVGVKGFAQEEDSELYWKDGKLPTEEEVDDFSVAVDLIKEGKFDTAEKKLKAFLKDYPESPLADDAKEGLEALNSKNKEG
ncbi:MAG: hypothetical protein KAR06_01470 [Deltaproteobacteria bacterium]|nr:hypothetical protein [Deltaproteobacteria bacterium]